MTTHNCVVGYENEKLGLFGYSLSKGPENLITGFAGVAMYYD